MFVITLASLVAVAFAGVVQHGNGEGHGQATSYQHVKLENYHPVPVYVKKEHQQYLDHPVSKGHSVSSLEVHHGGHHDHGYALVDATQQAAPGHEAYGGVSGGEGQNGHFDLGQEQVVQIYQDQGGAGGYEHEAAGYEQVAVDGFSPEAGDYGQQVIAYNQDNGGYGQDDGNAAYEQAAVAGHGQRGHHHH